MKAEETVNMSLSRRKFLRTFALGTAVVAYHHLIKGLPIRQPLPRQYGPASLRYNMNTNWLFGGEFSVDAIRPEFNDSSFKRITLPHCVSNLSWQNWEPFNWERMWIYRRHFDLPKGSGGRRIFLNFEGVMVGTRPIINGHEFSQFLCGYLPSRFEITGYVKQTGNVLAVQVDSRWSDTPPEGSPEGPRRIDYLEPGGIIRGAYLEVLPQIYISDIFVKPVKVLDADRHAEVTCTIDSAGIMQGNVEIEIELREGERVISRAKEQINVKTAGQSEILLGMSGLGSIELWSPDRPKMYDVIATLFVDGHPVHDYRVRTGFRDARFELDGFYLNGKRVQLFGLNRHELYPYVGFAMPERVMRRDAEIIRHKFNCNMVRCSHYPQSEAFINACDELGLMVWEEVPGWGYIGDERWKELLIQDVKGMIVRDRNHPSIIVWGTRVNESANDVNLYKRTREIAKRLDDTRPSSGTMTSGSRKTWLTEWAEDVFAYDDYHADPQGGVGIDKPVPGVPYLVTEAVGQFNYRHPSEGFNAKYRRAGDVSLQMDQAIWHAQAHSKAGADKHISGLIAWCAFDYGSMMNSYNNVKCPGVSDIFRIPKLGASFYLAQVNPTRRAVIEANFYWDFGPATPNGPGKRVAVFSNCEKLKVYIDAKYHSTSFPDRDNFPNVKYPPFFLDLEFNRESHPTVLRIDGYIGDSLIVSRSYSSDRTNDVFTIEADNDDLVGDGIDATRLEFKVTDKFGNPRLHAGGRVRFSLSGPGELIGDDPFELSDSGGVGAVWVRSKQGTQGLITIKAIHSELGETITRIKVERVRSTLQEI